MIKLKENGFTLSEILVVVCILIITALPLMYLYMSSIKGLTHSKIRTEALILTQDTLEGWMNTPFSPSINQTSNVSIIRTDHSVPYTIYSFLTTTSSPEPHRRVRVETLWRMGNTTHKVEMTTIIRQW